MIFGEYEYETIDINKLVFLPQVRKRKNAKIDDIADSIMSTGLINPLDVARLNYDELNKHITFLNQLWKKDVNIDSFDSIEGYYYVLIAGHTRLEALKRNAKLYKREDEVAVKIHKAKTSEEILAIQLNENIYTEPRLEERAIAIIETYRLGILTGKWRDKNEFIKQNQKFSRRVMNDAVIFANLPIEIQEYVFSNNIPYAVGVELGRIFPLIEKYENTFDKSEKLFHENVKFHYAKLLIKLQRAKSIKNALSIISVHSKTLNDSFKTKEELQCELSDFWDFAMEDQGLIRQKQLINEYNEALQNLNKIPFEYFMKLYSLDENLTGDDHSLDIQSINKLYNTYSKEKLLNKKR